MSSDNQVVGATGASLTVSFTNNNLLHRDGKIIMTFPYWNHKSPTNSFIDMISSATPTCTGSGALEAGLLCSYED